MRKQKSKLTTVPIPLMDKETRMAYIESQLTDYMVKLHCDSDELVRLANAMSAACEWANRHDQARYDMLRKQAEEKALQQLQDERERKKAAKDLRTYRNRTEAILDNIDEIY